MTEKWMTCTTCKAIVQLNATGICLGCQGGFAGQQEEDKYVPIETKLKTKEKEVAELIERQKELEDALQKHKSEKIHVQPKTSTRKRVRGGNAKRKETSKKNKEE